MVILDSYGRVTQTLLGCTLLGTDPVGGRVGIRNHCAFVEGCRGSEYKQPNMPTRTEISMPRNNHSKLKWPVAEKRLAPRCNNLAIVCLNAGLNFQLSILIYKLFKSNMIFSSALEENFKGIISIVL
jgi:hypothetical protein